MRDCSSGVESKHKGCRVYANACDVSNISCAYVVCVCVQYLGWLSGTSERNSIRRERKVTRAGRDNRRRERERARAPGS